MDDEDSDSEPAIEKRPRRCETCLAIGFQIKDKDKAIAKLNEELDVAKAECKELRQKQITMAKPMPPPVNQWPSSETLHLRMQLKNLQEEKEA